MNEPISPRMDNQKKKIVLIGPKASGKTTFKRIFFDAANPVQLIKTSLDPTRGVETDTYAAFSRFLAVWDLSGQELESWLGKRADVLAGSSIIVCMLGSTEPFIDSVSFLVRLLKARALNTPSVPVFIVLSKCDLISEKESYNRLLKIEAYMKEKHPEFKDECHRTKIHRVAITDAYFLRALKIAYQIIEFCIDSNDLRVSSQQLAGIKTKIKILAKLPSTGWIDLNTVSLHVRLGLEETHQQITELINLDYVHKERETFFALSEKGKYFMNACKMQSALLKSRAMMEKISFFFKLRVEMERVGIYT